MKNIKYQAVKLLGILSPIVSTSVNAQNKSQPNIVIILADDLGFGDVSCHRGITPTPNIDRLISQGTEFSNFMTYTVSSPSRAGLLTGLNPLRTGNGPEADGYLLPTVTTFGSYFKKCGYNTGLFGKWHNSTGPDYGTWLQGVGFNESGSNVRRASSSVLDYGFDHFVGFYGGGMDYFTKPAWYHDNKRVTDEKGYSTDLIAQYAIDFMQQSKVSSKPFLCYIPFNAVHRPHNITDEALKRVPASLRNKVLKLRNFKEYNGLTSAPFRKEFQVKGESRDDDDEIYQENFDPLTPEEMALVYSADIISLDDNVGRIMEYLKKSNLLENTIIVYFSDNGGVPQIGNNSPFRGYKHTLFEGGIHSAAAIIVPTSILPTSKKKVTDMCGYLDIFPTLAALSGVKEPLPKVLDGVNITDYLKGIPKTLPKLYYYWAWTNYDVIRSSKWKLFRYFNKIELYDIANDIAETTDVSQKNPEIVKQLLEQIEVEAQKVGIANAHVPLQIKIEKAKPEGKVLAITFEIKTNDDMTRKVSQIIKKRITPLSDCYLDFDIKVDSGTNPAYCYFSPAKNKNILFNSQNGVDQLGRLQQSISTFGKGWEHRSIGLGSFAPHTFNSFDIILQAKSKGKITVYLDNILIKNLKGEVVQELFTNQSNKNLTKETYISVVTL